MKREEKLKSVFELGATFQHVIFKEFFQDYELPEGMNPTQMKALMMLLVEGIQPMSELSTKLNLEKGSFTSVANKLIDLGHIQKTRNEVDKRVYELSLTESGKALADDLAKSHRDYIIELFSTVDEEEKQLFYDAAVLITDVLRRVSKNIDDLHLMGRCGKK